MRVLVPLAVSTRPPALGARVHRLEGPSMGTTWRVAVAGAPALDLAALRSALEAELQLVIEQMSHWEPGSDLSRFNAAPAGSQHTLPAAFAEVMQAALQVAEQSGGAFDPAAGALVDAWGFGAGDAFREPGFVPPDTAAIEQARTAGGWQRLALDGDRLHQPGGLRLDLSAIAKGHAVDRLTRCLLALGLDDHLVEVGGELRGSGIRPDGQPWWVDIASPDDAAPTTRVALHGLAVATSGDYLRCHDDGGTRRPHTIDPRSGWPIGHGLASVSVLHEDGLQADAWSTALTVLGLDEGLALATRRGLAALFVQRRSDGGFEEHTSPALDALAD